jgi:Ca-activated chloride channel family protein
MAASLAKKWGIRVYTISIQEREPPKIVKTASGEFLTPNPLSESDEILKKMAEMTGGIFRKAYDFDSLRAVYKEIDSLEKSRMKAVAYKDYGEGFPPFALAALAFVFLAHLGRATVLRVAP